MSYFRVPPEVWEPQHYAARWSPQDPAPEWWATIDAGWMIDRLRLPPEREQAEAWGWGRDRTARFLAARIKEQAADEKRADKRAAIENLRAARAPAKRQPRGTELPNQEPASGATANAENCSENQPETSQRPASDQPETCHARVPLPEPTATATATAHTTGACVPAVAGVELHPAATRPAEPPPPDAADWLAILDGHPKAARIARLLYENRIRTVEQARRYTPDELRGFVGAAYARLVADALERAGTPIAAGRKPATPPNSPALDAWLAMLAGRWPTDGPAAAALRAIGGSSAVRARTSFDETRLRDRFLATYDQSP